MCPDPATAREELTVFPGRPFPLGAAHTAAGLGFAVVSGRAHGMALHLFSPDGSILRAELPLDPAVHRTGDVWHVEVCGLRGPVAWAWRLDTGGSHRSGPLLLDPYARATVQPPPGKWSGRWLGVLREGSRGGRPPRPRLSPGERVIYELNVRGFTRHPSAAVGHLGTYRGLVEKIPYLRELGITTVQLLPVQEFDEHEIRRVNPITGEPLRNLWGYSPLAFSSPKASYAADPAPGRQVEEVAGMVDAFHEAGLEVFLDVVFNHTGEGDGGHRRRTVSFRGVDPERYYLHEPGTGKLRDFTGCGNTVRCNEPAVQDLIVDALRWWAVTVGIDGFRFDLASVLCRDRDGEPADAPPVVERIARDPVLAERMLIAEPWDAAGLYQAGSFPHFGRWAEWNGPFRDDVRRFVRGDAGSAAKMAERLQGSPDLYRASGRLPEHSVNFVTCHDGYTLADLVAYEEKHNWANGEGNRDGSDDNLSWNCGSEGSTRDPGVTALRRRQVRNLLTLLLLARGTPMLLGGDEMGRTQQGNNNAYCQDNDIGWVDWSVLEEHRDLHRFVRCLLAFRRAQPVLSAARFPGDDEIGWHGRRPGEPEWDDGRLLVMQLHGSRGRVPDDDVLLLANMRKEEVAVELPAPPAGRRWLRVVDTARDSPGDIADPGAEEPVGSPLAVIPHACLVLKSSATE
jgi:isoamylase